MQTLKNRLLAILLSLAASMAFADLGPGQTLPPLDISLLDGKTLTSTELTGKPAAYLFWATWCPICREELPAYQQLQVRYQARGFRVIALSLDKSESEVKRFWADAGYTIPVAMRTDELRDAFGDIRGTPTLYLIDRKGRLVKKHLGGISAAELEAMIKQLL